MVEIHKNILVDENRKPVAVQIPFDEFQRIEEVIENFGLTKSMEVTEDDERLCGDEAKAFYKFERNCFFSSGIANQKWSVLTACFTGRPSAKRIALWKR